MTKSYLAGIFGRSPVKPMQKHMQEVDACVAELIVFVKASIAGDESAMIAARREVVAQEQKADALKKDIRLQLPDSLFMPVPRRDLLELLRMQDKVANRAKDISGLMLGRMMKIPAAIAEDYLAFVKRCADASRQATKVISELDELFETGFSGREVKRVLAMLRDLDTIERETDDLQIKIRAELFAVEQELPPIDVMFLYKIIDWTGDLADRAQRVGSNLELLLAR